MADPKGAQLLIPLAASQVRRRLKGHGFGVRKVHSAGRNQAIIIHTATGEHLRELVSLFRDVMPPLPQAERESSSENLENHG